VALPTAALVAFLALLPFERDRSIWHPSRFLRQQIRAQTREQCDDYQRHTDTKAIHP
jgi:hypothetical protein